MSTSRTTSTNGNYATGGRREDTVADKAKEYASDAIDQSSEYAQQAQDAAVEKLGEFEIRHSSESPSGGRHRSRRRVRFGSHCKPLVLLTLCLLEALP